MLQFNIKKIGLIVSGVATGTSEWAQPRVEEHYRCRAQVVVYLVPHNRGHQILMGRHIHTPVAPALLTDYNPDTELTLNGFSGMKPRND